MRRSIVKIEVMLFAPTIACSEFRRFFALTLLAVLVLLTATACGEPEPPPTTIAVSPLWPQAGKIAFVSERDGNEEIYVMNADGSGQTRLTNAPAADWYPRWSPDGRHLAFSSNLRVGSEAIYVMNADGSRLSRLTTAPGWWSSDLRWDRDPSWSSDGRHLAFSSTRDGNAEIYVMNADGSGQTRLTNAPAADSDPSWSPGSVP